MTDKNKVGRPATGLAKTGAQREAKRRKRLAEEAQQKEKELENLRAEVTQLREKAKAYEVLKMIVDETGEATALLGSFAHVKDAEYVPLDITAGLYREIVRTVSTD